MTERRHITELDGLRGVAIVLVLGTHLWTYPNANPFLNRLFGAGWMGVDLFFVLSGFLITGVLLDTKASRFYWKSFYARRALRIFPPYYVLLGIALLVLPVVNPSAGLTKLQSDGWWYVFYLANLHLAAGGWVLFLLDITWSLSIEEQFYLFWPAVVKWLTPERVIITCCTLIVAAPVVRTILLYGLGVSWRWTHMMTPLRADAFAVGGLLALAHRGHLRVSSRVAASVAALGILAIVVLVGHGKFARESYFVGSIGYSLTALTSGAVLMAALDPGRTLSAALNLRPLRHLGTVSYGVYLYHPLCLLTAGAVSGLAGLDMAHVLGSDTASGFLQLVSVGMVAWGVATASFVRFERPILNLKTHYSADRPRRLATVVARRA